MNSTVDFKIKVEKLPCEIKSEYEPDTDTNITKPTIKVSNVKEIVIPSEKSCNNMSKVKEEITQSEGTVCDNLEEQDNLNLENLPMYKGSYDSYINEVKALATIPIIKTVTEEQIRNFKHFNERYYEDRYCINFGVTDPALASGNDIIQNGSKATHVNFVINHNDRSDIQLKGKRKRGSKAVEKGTILCQVTCEDGKIYNVRAGISAKIIEINEHIKTNPNLLRSDPKGLGFIAVLTPQGRPDSYEQSINQQGLLSEEEYNQYLLTRPPN